MCNSSNLQNDNCATFPARSLLQTMRKSGSHMRTPSFFGLSLLREIFLYKSRFLGCYLDFCQV